MSDRRDFFTGIAVIALAIESIGDQFSSGRRNPTEGELTAKCAVILADAIIAELDKNAPGANPFALYQSDE